MPARVMELIVTGEDAGATDVLVTIGKQVFRLSDQVAALNPEFLKLASSVEHVAVGADSATTRLAGTTAGVRATASASARAATPLIRLAGTVGVVSRRAARGVTQLMRLSRAVSGTGEASAASVSGWLVVGAGILAVVMVGKMAIGVIRSIGRAVVSMGRKLVEWAGLFDRAETSIVRVTSVTSRMGKEIQIGSAALATSQRSVIAFSGSTEELESHLRSLLAVPTGNVMNRWDTAVTQLGTGVGTALKPAVEALMGPLIELVYQHGPAVIAWATDAGTWLADRLPGAIQWTIDAVEKLSAALSLLVRTSPIYQIGGLLTTGYLPLLQAGTRFAGGGLSIVGERGPELMQVPRGSRVWSNRETQQMVGGHQISVQIGSIGGDPYQAGRQIGKGILAELRTRGAA